MIRLGNRAEALSDSFADFCREHALVDRKSNVNRYWEYPWAYYHSRLRPGMRVLDAGAGYSPFLYHLAERVPGAEYHAADPSFRFQAPAQLAGVRISERPLENLDYSDDYFDLVFCLSVLEHLRPEVRTSAVRQMVRCLRPGGRLVLTVDYFLDWPRWHAARERKRRMYAWLPGPNVDVARLVADSGLEPLDPGRTDPHPGSPSFDESKLDLGELWHSEHIGPGLRVLPIGVVLSKPLPDGVPLTVSAEALHRRDNGEVMLGVHYGAGEHQRAQRYPLPPAAQDPVGFTAAQAAGWLGGGAEGRAVVEQALRWGALRPLDCAAGSPAAHQPETFMEFYG